MSDKDFLIWIRDRLEYIYNESKYTDYMIRLSNIINSMPDSNLIDLETGEQK